jgi:lipopolysaccharide/colanic/teichoic acid biosynthesis glycosyltransferase
MTLPNSADRKHEVQSDALPAVPPSRLNGVPPTASPGPRHETLGSTSPILSEELFSQLLVRERKRSERSNRPFLLLSLQTKDHVNFESSPTGRAALRALSATTRGTDILGWVQHPTVVGVIFPEIGAAEPALAIETVRARLLLELGQRLGTGALGDFSLEFRVYPESSNGDSPSGPGPIDPIFHPDLVRDQQTRRIPNWIKRMLDIVASLALLLMLAPLFLWVAIAVRLTSPGPILFRQTRLGKMGKPFKMLKFRTMYVNAGENPHVEFISWFIRESQGTQTPAKDQLFKLTNDPRVTPVGRILRKTSIDELPQLWNVLIGQMSLVGPRPPLPYEFEQYRAWHRRRLLEAEPGITGLWQVTGRSRTTFEEMVRLDLRYARTQSLWTDLRILLKTPRAVVSGKGAC